MNRTVVLTLLVLLSLVVLVWVWSGTQTRTAPPPEPQATQPGTTQAGPVALRFASWNIANLGRSKDSTEIAVMAELLRDFDLVAIQEVVTSPHGAQAVGRLGEALKRMGAEWDYRISDPTTGTGTERYAFLWKPSRVRMVGRPWLEASLADALDREPFLGRFAAGACTVLVASFHAVPKAKKPEHEIVQLEALPRLYADDALVLAGDFNLDEDHEAFEVLYRQGFTQALDDQPTTLKMFTSAEGEHLASEYDNLFYHPRKLQAHDIGILDFSDQFPTLKDARYISDHLPIHATFSCHPGV